MLYTPLQCIFVPFRRCFGKADGLEHFLALRVKGVNIGLYAAHPLFLGQLQHGLHTAAADMAVLVCFANYDGDLAVIPQRDIPHQRAVIFDIVARPVCAEVVIHAVQQVHIVGGCPGRPPV